MLILIFKLIFFYKCSTFIFSFIGVAAKNALYILELIGQIHVKKVQ